MVQEKFEGRIWHNSHTVKATRKIFSKDGELQSKEVCILSSVEYLALLYQLTVIEKERAKETHISRAYAPEGIYISEIVQINTYSKYVYTFSEYLGLQAKN